jgi:hypothetical protein
MMPVRRRVVIVWAVLVALIAVVAVLEFTDNRARSAPSTAEDARRLLPVPVEAVSAIEIMDAGTMHRFQRSEAGAWFYHGVHSASDGEHSHAVDPVLAERIDAAVRAFARTRIERELPRQRDGHAYGVATPRMVILVYRPQETQPVVQYAIGDVAPDTVSRYVDIVGQRGVVTIPDYQIANLSALIQSLAASPAVQAAAPAPR